MPVAPITPDPGADGWGRPNRTPRLAGLPSQPPSQPPNADPDGLYRPAAVGGHRTARWFLLMGIALVILVAPLAIPMNDAEDDEPYLLNEAGADSLTAWAASPLNLAGLDRQCTALGETFLPGTLEGECYGAFGLAAGSGAGSGSGSGSGYGSGSLNEFVNLEIASMAGVSAGEGAATAARRSLRAIMMSDMSDVPLDRTDPADPADTRGVLHPTLARQTTELWTTQVLELAAPSSTGSDGLLDDLPDLPEMREPGTPADTRPVQYGGSTGGRYAVAASFLMDGPDGVLYTVAVTGANPDTVEFAANRLVGAVRAE
ncbi:hypothetical protein [Corynebacterium sp.]|uniref:hypothetical protein n=1 Tax=Corynebacterium sp. TaxID=1720 RepID=UPI003B3A344C